MSDYARLADVLKRLAVKQPLADSLRGVNLGPNGGDAIADSLRGSPPSVIATVDLYGCNIADEGALPLAQRLCDLGGCEIIDLGANGLAEVVPALSPLLLERAQEPDDEDSYGCGGLRELRLSRNSISSSPLAAMLTPADAPTALLSLTSLALSFNPLGAAGGGAIGTTLAAGRMPALTCLQLQACKLGAEGVSALAAGLERARGLTHIDLSDNAAGDAGACAVAAAVPYTRLEELLLSRNLLSDQSGQALAAALVRRRKCSLRMLSLASNRLRDPSAIAFAEALGAPRPHGNRSLECLDLSANKLRPPAVVALGDALVANGRLRALDLSRQPHIDAEALEAIAGLLRLNRRATQYGEEPRPPKMTLPSENEHVRQYVDPNVQKLMGPPGAWLAPRASDLQRGVGSAAGSAHVLVKQSNAAASTHSELCQVQLALENAGNECARLRHREAMLLQAVREVMDE